MAYYQLDSASEAFGPLRPQALVRQWSRWMRLLGAGLGLAGFAAGLAGCSRPTASSEPVGTSYSQQEIDASNRAVCDAYKKGMRSLWASGTKKADSPADRLPVAVNTRLAEVTTGNFLINTIHDNPAAEKKLKDLANKLAQTYQEMALIQLSDGSTIDFEPQQRTTDELIPQIDKICQ